jgi:hypothetical protein
MKKLLIICALIGLLIPPATASADWSSNLLLNPGAEAGSLNGWTTDDPVVVGASQSQHEASGYVYPHSGNWFFNMAVIDVAPSGETVSRILYQDVNLNSYASYTDAGLLGFEASVYLQTEDTSTFSGADYGQLTLYFLDGVGSVIDSLSTGLVQSPNLTWVLETLNGTAPAGMRSIRFELLGEKNETTYINAFFDDASLQVVPEPGALFLLGLGGLFLKRGRKSGR